MPLPPNPRPLNMTDAEIDARVDLICNTAGLAPDFGLLPAGSPLRKLARVKPLRNVGAFRALMLEIGNPIVAQGVFDWSEFRTDPTGRLERTGNFLNAMIFGTRTEVKTYAKRYALGHDAVRGHVSVGSCPDRTGEVYTGWQDEDREWVHASIFEAMFFAYDTIMSAPLTAYERDAAWVEAVRVGEVIGLTPANLAPDYASLEAWMNARLAATTSGTTPVSNLRPQLHIHNTVNVISRDLFALVPALWGISTAVAWHTVPAELRPLIPQPIPAGHTALWLFFRDTQRLQANSLFYWVKWSTAYRDYAWRTGDWF
jgi:uncharacterized protein (DUF2236 family)